ncbi:MAG: bifunctional nuclease family protein [Bacteroidia bacterium]|nr:bifunctional nuclease family protein [Bacteroidia bacterium]
MGHVKLNVLGLSYSQTQAGAYALVLAEDGGHRRIPIIIGGFEAQAIAIELEGLKPPRPLTHDLILSFALSYNIHLEEVNIYKLEEGIFHSELICNNGKERVRIDARTSDAVALALRFKCPIYTTEEIIAKAGIVLDVETGAGKKGKSEESVKSKSTPQSREINPFTRMSDKDLKDALTKAVTEEDYEKASKIRDEIKHRGI